MANFFAQVEFLLFFIDTYNFAQVGPEELFLKHVQDMPFDNYR